mgnify:CR=1 FL=1
MGRFCPNTNFTFFSRRPIQVTLSTEQIMFWGDFAPGKILSRVGFSPMIYHSITLNIHQDQVMYFSGFFVVGGFHPNKNSTFSNVNHYSQDSCRSSFVFLGILSRQQFYLLFMWSNMVNTQYRANHVLVRFCPWEDFIPGRIQSFDLSLHYCKHSTISSFVFFKFFCHGGILSQQQLYHILCTPLQ